MRLRHIANAMLFSPVELGFYHQLIASFGLNIAYGRQKAALQHALLFTYKVTQGCTSLYVTCELCAFRVKWVQSARAGKGEAPTALYTNAISAQPRQPILR